MGSGEEAPDQLLAHPSNWRVHAKAQRAALRDVLGSVGFVARVIVNQRTGHLVDDHLRAEEALSRGQPTIPVLYSLELIAVRRILEEAATGLAARNIDADGIGLLTACLDRMRSAETHEVLVKYDERFHALVASASGNTTLASLLAGVSSQTVRARVWRGNLDRGVVARTISQHEDIVAALVARDPELAEATATIHVATTEAWIKATVAAGSWPDHAARADEA